MADRDPALDRTASADGDAVGSSDGAAAMVTVLDRFLVAGLLQEVFDAHLAAGRIAVAGQQVPTRPRRRRIRWPSRSRWTPVTLAGVRRRGRRRPRLGVRLG